jgi:Holliday junction resolvase
MVINSRNKGAEGEREFAKICREHGYDGARRGQQFSGIEGEDVVGLPGIHIEVKRVEALNIEKAMAQSRRDAKDGEIPIVAHRKNRCEWLITMPAEQWFKVYREWEALREVL